MARDNNEAGLQETCPQCPTPALRSQCPHTPEGREYLKQQRLLRQSTSEPSNTSLPPWFNYWSPSKGPTNPPYQNSWHGPPLGYGMPTQQPMQIDPTLFHNPPVPSQLIRFPAIPGNPGATTDATFSAGASIALPTASSATVSSSPANGSDHSDDGEETPLSSRSTRGRRVRITRKNAVHGKVDGAMRGSKPFDILRMKEPRPAIVDQAEASARFLRQASDIIERCERLSQETGCWLHFSAQHLFAQGGFLHYTSPRLLREAKKDAEQIINHANRVYATLIAARNEESKDMHKRLLLAEEDKQAAQEAERNAVLQTQAVQRERDLQDEELSAQRLELEALKAKLKLAERRNGLSQ